MSLANKYNSNRKFNISTEGFPYRKLREVYNDPAFGPDTIIPVDACYINTGGKYGESACLASVHFRMMLSLPKHQVPMIKDVLEDQEAIQQIKEGRAAVKIIPWTDAKGDTFYKTEWVDIEVNF